MLDKITGEALNTFDSMKAAAEFLKLKSKGISISNCCRGESKTSGGYKWEYV